MSTLLGVLLWCAGKSLQQKDPLKDFCRRFGHQTAIIDQKLYIDGGLLNWNPIAQNPRNYSNTGLLFQDLTSSPPSVQVPQLYANLTKNSSIPDVSGGILWADDVNKRIYLYGGDYSDITPNSPNLLAYDPLHDQWNSFGPPNRPIQSVSWGGGVGISSLGQGYVLGGWLSNASVAGWSGGPLATNSLIKYDMNTNDWTNNTGPADSLPRAEGVMLYVPASDDGLLVYFGGVTAPYNNETFLPAPMTTIQIYDIRSSKWYTQDTVGNAPLSRRRFCAGVVAAQDYSSYNIYLYGGLGFGQNASGFDDLYILSLPTFTWIPWWEGSDGGLPHHSLSCNVVGGQMLIIGGTFPLSDTCDSPPTWGTHNVDLGEISGHMWNIYMPNITSYSVPPEVIAVVGGSALGGATATAPPTGFNNGDLGIYFAQKATAASRTPTRSIPAASSSAPPDTSGNGISKGAIAGIAVGGTLVLAALLVAGFCCVRRHRRKNSPPPVTEVVYNPAPAYPFPPHTPQSPYSDHGQGHQQPEQEHYQLAANSPPAELSGSTFPLHQFDPKANMIQEIQDSPRNTPPPWPHQISPSLLSHPSQFSGAGGAPIPYDNGPQVSPTPTYSSLGETSKRPAPVNQTFYSP
ncbi:cell wall anchored protein [Diplocarpon rosae]|nr:cell wall anchored protein [Diplocarpon rosae]